MAIRGPGRNPLPALQRVISVVSFLAASPGGVSAEALVDLAGYSGAPESQRDQLARDIRHLVKQGWRITNEAGPGAPAFYRLDPGDPRVRLVFSPDEQQAFERAARMAGISVEQARRSSQAPSAEVEAAPGQRGSAYLLELVLHAHEHRCLLNFRYREVQRTVIPDAVWVDGKRWYVLGRQADESERNFRIDRIEDLTLGPPGSAGPAKSTRVGADPLLFSDGPAISAQVLTHPDHRRRVERSLGQAESVERIDSDTLILTIPVISHLTFLRRLCELGTRVKLIGPEPLRDELRQLLYPHRSR